MKKIATLLIAVTIISGVFAQKLDRSKKPLAGPAPEIKLGDIKSFTLANGLKVFVVENHKLPKVSFSLSLDIDPILEGEMAGYISATGSLLGRATTTKTKEQLDEEIDFMGATLNTGSQWVYASSLKKHQDKLLTLMSDVIMNPVFKQEELDKIKKQTISGIVSAKDNPDAIAGNVRSVLLYGKDHPYGELSTEETVEKITLEKCKEYFTTYFKPNVAYLAVVGDITVEEAKPLMEKYFGAWKKGDVPVHEYKTPLAPQKTRVAVVHKEGATQSVVNITYPVDYKNNSTDVVKARIMNAILGGGSTARLFMNLREGHGFTYGAYSSLSSDQLVGNFNANAKVRNEVTDSSVTQFMVELNRIVNEKVTEKELQDVKNYLSGTFAYSLQNPQTIARFAINIEKYGLPKDHYSTYLQQISAVTVDDIQAMAKKYIQPNNAFVLVVGDKSVAESLAQFSADKKVELLDIYGNEWKEPLKPAPEGVTAKMVIDSSVKAKYGLPLGKSLTKKLKPIKDLTVKMGASIQGQNIEIVRYQKSPNKFSQVMSMNTPNGPMVIQKQSFNGVVGKASGMQGEKSLKGKELEEMKANSILFVDTKYDELGFKFELLGIEPVEGKDAYKMVSTQPNGDTKTEWYDVATKLQVKSMQTQDDGKGGSIAVITTYADYKEVDGIQYAHTIKESFGPQSLDMKVISIEQNKGLEDTIFE
ncbi:MAG: insulinase family protein [Vicingus serpentipes]|nr:insulinase family protein [Vicingus serpentipes]